MAYVFKEGDLPSLIDAKQARERIFFVNQELANIDDMLAGVMHYKKDAASPLHLHKNCEHFYFIIDGKATVESDEGDASGRSWRHDLHPGRGEAPAARHHAAVLFRVAGAQPLQDDDSGRHRRRSALGP